MEFPHIVTCSRQGTSLLFFFFNDTATTEIYTLSLHDALPISWCWRWRCCGRSRPGSCWRRSDRSEEHTSELQSRLHLVCRLLLEKKKKTSPPSDMLAIMNRYTPAIALALIRASSHTANIFQVR